MKNCFSYIGSLCLIIIFLYWTFEVLASPRINLKDCKHVHQLPRIDPDYAGIVLPPNIAPLNFIINERGTKYYMRIVSKEGKPIEIFSGTPKIVIPLKKWRELLKLNRGQEVHFEIFIRDKEGSWKQFDPIINQISHENIDGYLVYRIINPAYLLWQIMGIFQRDIQSFDEKPLLLNRATDLNCMNCHNFCNNDPENMMLHLRGGQASGTLITQDGKIVKVNTATKFNKAGAYPSWHPNGNIIAYSVNKLEMFFHAIGEPRDVLDRESDLILYQIDSNTITTNPLIADPERMETFPSWSPDGQYLYFCSAPKFELYIAGESYLYDQILYDLMRIRYNAEDGTWGRLETVLSSSETGLSMTMPRVSPDGRYLLFCTAKCGNFPVYIRDSDLFLMDLNTGEYRRLQINSDKAETFHSWSSNSRWFVFSSKRRDGICARPYFAYVDEKGNVHKPFVMPQEDPTFYGTFLKTYNVPELIKGPVQVRPQKLVKTAYDNAKKINAKLDPAVTYLRAQKEDKTIGIE